VPVDLLLDTELRRFEAVYASVDEAPTVVVELQASLVDGRKGTRIASFDSRAEVKAARNDRSAVVAAFEQATGKVVDDVAQRARAAGANLPR
jgi:cholesterol transport system auxiliary component